LVRLPRPADPAPMSAATEPLGPGGGLPVGTPGAGIPALSSDPLIRARPSNLWRDTIANILRQRSAVFGLIILAILILTAIFAPIIATHDPNASMLQLHEPGAVKRSPPCIHVLGCDAAKPQHLL